MAKVKVDIPLRQPDKMIEIAETITIKNQKEHILDNVLDINFYVEKIKEVKFNRAEIKKTNLLVKNLIQESNNYLGIAKGQTKATKGTIYSSILSIRDFLKNTFRGKEELLTEWGYDVEILKTRGLRKVKIHIPFSNSELLSILADSIYKRHLKQPLILKKFDMKEFNSINKLSQEKRKKATSLASISNSLNEESNFILGIGYGQSKDTAGTIYYLLSETLKHLITVYKNKEEQIKEWGFKINILDSSFPIKGSNITTKRIVVTTNQQPLITIHIKLKGSNNKKIFINWGDKSADKLSLKGHTTPDSMYHDYQEEAVYEIHIMGDISKLSYIDISSNQITAVDVPKTLKNLTYLNLSNNQISSQKNINNLLNNLNSCSVFNGELLIAGGTNATPTGLGVNARNSLISRGWEINKK